MRSALSQSTFLAQVEALLEETARLAKSDPASAARLPSLLAVAPEHAGVADLVDAGIASGDLTPGDRDLVLATLLATLVGLVRVGAIARSSPSCAVDGFKRLLAGTLILG